MEFEKLVAGKIETFKSFDTAECLEYDDWAADGRE